MNFAGVKKQLLTSFAPNGYLKLEKIFTRSTSFQIPQSRHFQGYEQFGNPKFVKK